MSEARNAFPRWRRVCAALIGLTWAGIASAQQGVEQLLASSPELSALHQLLLERETSFKLYGDLGDESLMKRYQELTPPADQGDAVYRYGSDHTLEAALARCQPPSCDRVKIARADLQSRLALLGEVARLRPLASALEQQIRAQLCTPRPCAVAVIRLGEVADRQVYLLRADTTDEGAGDFSHSYLARALVGGDGAIRIERLFASQADDCEHEPACIHTDYGQGFTYNPASGVASGEFAFNRNTWSYQFLVFPEVRPVRYKDAHWGFENYEDPETAFGSERSSDWVSGLVSGMELVGECPTGSASASTGAGRGYVVPLNGLPIGDWKIDAPAHRLNIRVPQAGADPPVGFMVPAAAHIDPAVSFWVSALDRRTLWLEISDPSIHVESSNWLHRSHIEIWTWEPPALARDTAECFVQPWLKRKAPAELLTLLGRKARTAAKPQQWVLDLDGKGIHVGFGDGPADAVAVQAARVGSSKVRMKIVLPAAATADDASEGRRIAIAYSPSDGRRQIGLLASSEFGYADPAGFTWIGEPELFSF